MKICASLEVSEMIEKDQGILDQIYKCIERFTKKDFGDVCEEDEKTNLNNLMYAMGVYYLEFNEQKIKIWIKRDSYILTVLKPNEY